MASCFLPRRRSIGPLYGALREFCSRCKRRITVRRATGAPTGAERGSWGPASEGEGGSAGAKPPGSGWILQAAAVAGALLVWTVPAQAQLDPLLFLKRVAPNVLLVVDTRASMLN